MQQVIVYHVPTGKKFVGKLSEQTEEIEAKPIQLKEIIRLIGQGRNEVTHMILNGDNERTYYIPGTILKECVFITDVGSIAEDSLRDTFCKARDRLLSSIDLTHEEQHMLNTVSLRVHDADTMYEGDAFHYLSVGLSASRCIREALRQTPEAFPIKTILDFPCGYGRVLRFLRIMFQDADITAAEIDRMALDFCRRTFSVTTLLSEARLSNVSVTERFDLIWCGSLFTHIDEQDALNLLQFFHDHLSENGVCIFTTHGQRSIDLIQSKNATYNLAEEAQQKVIRECQSKGYGYTDYFDQPGYGISIVSHERMVTLAQGVGRWHEVFFLEHGWDNHHDVYAFSMHKSNK